MNKNILNNKHQYGEQSARSAFERKKIVGVKLLDYLNQNKHVNCLPMNFKDILNLFKIGKASAKSHMRNLIEIAASDGSLGDEEQRLQSKS